MSELRYCILHTEVVDLIKYCDGIIAPTVIYDMDDEKKNLKNIISSNRIKAIEVRKILRKYVREDK